MEFLAFVSMLMIILAALYGVITSKQIDTYEESSTSEAYKVAETVGFELEMALVQGEGYSRVFSLPSGIGGSEYNLTVSDNSVLVEYRDERVISSTRYPEQTSIKVDGSQNIFKVKNNATGVFLVEK